MRYAVWLLRLGFAAWLVPAGLNWFYPLFPQPMGNQPQSTALITALIDSGLFTVVKAVELVAGLCLLVGWRVPLALVALLPVSFNVWYWDVPLQGWGSVSAYYGWAVLGATLLLMLAWHRSYAGIMDPVAAPQWPPRLARTEATAPGWLGLVRLALGLLLALVALDNVLAVWLPFPVGTTPMAFEFLEALHFSRLIYVAMGLTLVAGFALLVGRFVPLVLAAVLPVLVCMGYWALVLEQSAGWTALALVLAGLAVLLMFADLPAYAGMLQPRPLAAGEDEVARFERVYGWPVGPTAPRLAAVALVPLVLAAAFYQYFVPSLLAYACVAVLAWSLGVLVLRTLQALLVKPERGE